MREEGGEAMQRRKPHLLFPSVCPHILLNIQHLVLYLVPSEVGFSVPIRS